MKKQELILELLAEVQSKRKRYLRRWTKLRKINDVTEMLLISCSSFAVSNLVVTLATINPITLIIGSAFSVISAIGNGCKSAYKLHEKLESLKTTYQQLSDLERETRAILSKNHMSDEEYENLLTDINHRFSLIEDTAIPMTNP